MPPLEVINTCRVIQWVDKPSNIHVPTRSNTPVLYHQELNASAEIMFCWRFQDEGVTSISSLQNPNNTFISGREYHTAIRRVNRGIHRALVGKECIWAANARDIPECNV